MNIIFLNSKIQKCGVYQYGKRVYDILKKCNEKFNYKYEYDLKDYKNSHTISKIICPK